MKLNSLNEDRRLTNLSMVQARLAQELEERQELACWFNGSCGSNGKNGINVTAG